VIGTLKLPFSEVLLAVIVTTLVPVVGFGVNEAVTPFGNCVAARFTLPVKPYKGFTVMVDVPEPPWAMEIGGAGLTRVKLGGDTVR